MQVRWSLAVYFFHQCEPKKILFVVYLLTEMHYRRSLTLVLATSVSYVANKVNDAWCKVNNSGTDITYNRTEPCSTCWQFSYIMFGCWRKVNRATLQLLQEVVSSLRSRGAKLLRLCLKHDHASEGRGEARSLQRVLRGEFMLWPGVAVHTLHAIWCILVIIYGDYVNKSPQP